MFGSEAEFHTAIIEEDPEIFVSRHIFEPVPYAFSGDFGAWVEWKHRLGQLIDVDARDIVITGSASVGFSLNPQKDSKKFDETSDIDCGIISEYYFNVAWRYLRQRRVEWLTLSNRHAKAINSHRSEHVFTGTIAADRFLELLPFGLDWQRALEAMAKVPPTIGRDIKMRIYRDFDTLRMYQISGINLLRTKLLLDAPVEEFLEEIPLEDGDE